MSSEGDSFDYLRVGPNSLKFNIHTSKVELRGCIEDKHNDKVLCCRTHSNENIPINIVRKDEYICITLVLGGWPQLFQVTIN